MTLPEEPPGACPLCGLKHRPVSNGRCDLCRSAFGDGPPPSWRAILRRIWDRLLQDRAS